MNPEPFPNPWPLVAIALAVFVLFLVGSRRRDVPGLLRGLSALAASIALLAALAETGWYVLGARSDNNNRTFASRLWHERHWKPINSLGFRDIEHAGVDYSGKRVLFVVGDSFIAGQGIEDPADRLPDLLRAGLGDEWAVVCVAKPGWNTWNELGAIDGVIEQFGLTPDAVVLAYVLNDIVDPRYLEGRTDLPRVPPPPSLPETGLFAWLANHSFAANEMAWWIGSLGAWKNQSEHWEALEAAYAHPEIVESHRADLRAIADRCRALDAPLFAVVFPNLVDVGGTSELCGRVAGWLESHGADVIDLGFRYADRRADRLVVSLRDTHPNESVHAELAKLLRPRIEALAADR